MTTHRGKERSRGRWISESIYKTAAEELIVDQKKPFGRSDAESVK